MLKICKYIDFISQIRKRYARNMPEIFFNVHIIFRICHNYAIICFQVRYAKNMQIYRLY